MEKEFKSFEMKLDTLTDTGEFSGYAAVFGNVDQGGDLIQRGAFKKTLREHKGRIPILDHHDPLRHIGWNVEAQEDERGLFVKGLLDLNVRLARERHSLMKMAQSVGGKTGLSIGYRTIKESFDRATPEVRNLKELSLLEYSVVVFPMNQQAGITGIKQQKENLIITLENVPGFDKELATKGAELLTPLLKAEPDPNHSQKKEAGEKDLEPLKHSLKELLKTVKN